MGEIRRSLDAQRAHHIILLTDGHTYGDEQECLALAEQAAAQNIGITGMGIGNEWNDIFLDELASRTGGSSAYISKPKDIQQLLGNKFKALASIYAEEVTLEFRPQAGIRIIETFRLQPEGGPIARRDPWLLGPILQELPLNVLFEIEVQPEALKDGSATLLDGALKISMSTQTRPVPPVRLTMSREVEAEASSEPPPKEILLALSHMTLYRMQERAHGETEAGRYENAAKHLENIASHLHAQGRHQLAKTAALEAEHLERMHTWSESGRKEIKFGTRALLLASGRDSIL
jgi:Ca-activated chloride channel family protein